MEKREKKRGEGRREGVKKRREERKKEGGGGGMGEKEERKRGRKKGREGGFKTSKPPFILSPTSHLPRCVLHVPHVSSLYASGDTPPTRLPHASQGPGPGVVEVAEVTV